MAHYSDDVEKEKESAFYHIQQPKGVIHSHIGMYTHAIAETYLSATSAYGRIYLFHIGVFWLALRPRMKTKATIDIRFGALFSMGLNSIEFTWYYYCRY